MPMNLIIQKRRKELGLTQEQIAGCLNVSIPAVSKWEKGITSPDISLLPSLARLLKIDLNTLFCFQEDITRQEINCFFKELTAVIQSEGFGEGFEKAKQKLRQYPHSETLLHYLTIHLDGLLVMSGLSPEETLPYDTIIDSWYCHLSKSSDIQICNSANYMRASRFIRKGDYQKAQEILDLMPNLDDVINSMADKRLLQTILYQHQGKAEEAAKELEYAFVTAVNKVQLLLCKMVDAELITGETQHAKNIADKSHQLAKLLDLWSYQSYIAPLQTAVAEKNIPECLCLFRNMLEAMLTPWNMSGSSLFHRIAKTSDPRQMMPAVLSEMEKSSAYDFLRDCREFQELISEYWTLLSFDADSVKCYSTNEKIHSKFD